MEKQGDKMKTYTTDEMIIVLSKIDFDITFLLEENRNIHVFNDAYRNICKGEYGSGDIVKFDKNDYINKKWVIK